MDKAAIDRRAQRRGIWIVLSLALLVLVKDLFTFLVVGDQPRDWDYGTLPMIPGESPISVQPLPPGAAPPQTELPPTRPGVAP